MHLIPDLDYCSCSLFPFRNHCCQELPTHVSEEVSNLSHIFHKMQIGINTSNGLI